MQIKLNFITLKIIGLKVFQCLNKKINGLLKVNYFKVKLNLNLKLIMKNGFYQNIIKLVLIKRDMKIIIYL